MQFHGRSAPIDQGARTLDGLKFRVRAGMGRCQVGFCTLRCMQLLSERLGIPILSPYAEENIAGDVDLVVIGTPLDLLRLIKIDKPAVWARYDVEFTESPNLP